MRRFSGNVGFVTYAEDPNNPGITRPVVTEKHYYGEVTQQNFKINPDQNTTNGALRINDAISLVGNKYMYDNIGHMRYVCYMGTKWNISNIQDNRPRIIVNLGEVYNGPTTETA